MNLLFVFADELRAQAVACHANRDVQTPVLDRLAAEGVVFDHAYSTTPVCTPVRGSLLTGCWPRTHGAATNDLPIKHEGPTLARSLNAAGYLCGYVGKWHLGGLPRDRFTPPGPGRLGFDAFWASWECSHAYMNPRWHEDTPEVHAAPGRYEPEVQTDLALGWLERLSATESASPFCLFVSYGPPHEPYLPAAPGREHLYDPAALTLPPNVPAELTEAERTDLANYYAHTTAIDEQFGRLVAYLKDHDLLDDTLVVFSSDHGTMLGSHGRHGKQLPFEESIAIPLVMRGGPTLGPVGRHDPLLVGMVDLAPTLLGLLGLCADKRMQGRDLSAQIADPTLPERPSAVGLENALVVDRSRSKDLRPWWGVRTDRYTYARHLDAPWLLFDNLADPYQLSNLVDDAQLTELRQELDTTVYRTFGRVGEPIAPEDEYAILCGVDRLWEEKKIAAGWQ
jgi:arylsulfatase A-like enzyme